MQFKDKQNRWITAGLFEETATRDKQFVIMTLDEARIKFVDCGDPTGVEFADAYLGGYAHWKDLKASKALEVHIAGWEEELEVRIKCTQLKRIDDLSLEGHFQASKFMHDAGWNKRKAGKPSKAEVQRETRIQSKLDAEWDKDIIDIKR